MHQNIATEDERPQSDGYSYCRHCDDIREVRSVGGMILSTVHLTEVECLGCGTRWYEQED